LLKIRTITKWDVFLRHGVYGVHNNTVTALYLFPSFITNISGLITSSLTYLFIIERTIPHSFFQQPRLFCLCFG